MDSKTYIIIAAKLLEVCGQDKGAAIYSLIPLENSRQEYYEKIQGQSLENKPLLLNSALELLSGVKTGVAKNSHVYTTIKEEREELLKQLGDVKLLINLPSTISHDKISAALSLVSHSYVDCFFHPVQFFLPHSSACCGQWELWERNNYFELLKKTNEKEFQFNFRDKLIVSKIWNIKFNPEHFSEIVRRRLSKEKAFDKKLNLEAMIKAMVIRMGEMAKPTINYEVIDYSIRSFFTYLGVKKYLRVDREIKFLIELEKEIMTLLGE